MLNLLENVTVWLLQDMVEAERAAKSGKKGKAKKAKKGKKGKKGKEGKGKGKKKKDPTVCLQPQTHMQPQALMLLVVNNNCSVPRIATKLDQTYHCMPF